MSCFIYVIVYYQCCMRLSVRCISTYMYVIIQVLWEVYSAQIAGTLPQLYDLLFLCDKRAQLQSVPGEAGRPGSQSMVFNFTGQPGMYSVLCVWCLLVEKKNIYLISSLYGVYEMKKCSIKYIITLCPCTCTYEMQFWCNHFV